MATQQNVDGWADTKLAPGEESAGDATGSAYKDKLPQDDAGRYQVLGEHARGGLGRVLEARDDRLGRVVAIKELLDSSRFAESLFVREALITARLQHPGIVPVHEAGRWPSGDPFYVMKLVAGRSLQEIIRETTTTAERLAYLPNVLTVVETIAYAHSEGVLHRDIKPANIIIGEFGETVVVDWGLARDDEQSVPIVHSLETFAAEAGDRDAQSGSTAPTATTARPGSTGERARPPADSASDTEAGILANSKLREMAPGTPESAWLVSGNYSVSGKVIGTPAYMAPEQARGREVDQRADVYALGALLYEVLAGVPPYPGKQLQVVLDRVLTGPPKSLAERDKEIPGELVTIVDKAMAREPDERYATAKELAEDLKRFQTGKLVAAHEYSSWALMRRWLWRHRSPVLVALAAVVVLAVVTAVSFDRIIDERNEARNQRAHARAAQKQAEQRENKLLLLQAQQSLDRDPTATVAWLKRAPLGGDYFAEARRYFDDAVSRGVSRHVIEHDGALFVAEFSPDGREVIAVERDGLVRRSDVETGRSTVLARADESFYDMWISPDGRWAAGAGDSGDVYLWDLTATRDSPEGGASGTRILSGTSGMAFDARFTADGEHLLVNYRDGPAKLWSTESALPESLIRGAIAMTRDGKRIVQTLGEDQYALIDAATGEPVWRTALPKRALFVRFFTRRQQAGRHHRRTRPLRDRCLQRDGSSAGQDPPIELANASDLLAQRPLAGGSGAGLVDSSVGSQRRERAENAARTPQPDLLVRLRSRRGIHGFGQRRRHRPGVGSRQ